jgi:hypothetical protein
MLRSVVAIVVGFVVIAALSLGTDLALKSAMPQWFGPNGSVTDPAVLLLVMGYVAVYAVFGCWLAGRLAPDRPMRHALILGFLGLLFNVAGTIAMWGTAPAWYHVASLLLVMPYAWLGGRLAEATGARRTTTA